MTGPVTLADWTALTGAAALSPGLPYFLNTAGNLTSTVPSSPRCLTAVGIAVSTTTLVVNPEQPIQL